MTIWLLFFPEKPKVLLETENLLRNPRFEDALVSDSITGWLCQGQSNDPASGVLSQVYATNHGQGEYSGLCSKRVGRWAGPGQYIGTCPWGETIVCLRVPLVFL